MALFYMMMRAIAYALLKQATWKHRRAKTKLEKADQLFKDIENSCKAEEVTAGRPANFASQFKLMKLFEIRDGANDRWKAAASRLKNRQQFSTRLKKLSGRKMPYAVGLIDMALAFGGYQWLVSDPDRMNQISDLIARVM